MLTITFIQALTRLFRGTVASWARFNRHSEITLSQEKPAAKKKKKKKRKPRYQKSYPKMAFDVLADMKVRGMRPKVAAAEQIASSEDMLKTFDSYGQNDEVASAMEALGGKVFPIPTNVPPIIQRKFIEQQRDKLRQMRTTPLAPGIDFRFNGHKIRSIVRYHCQSCDAGGVICGERADADKIPCWHCEMCGNHCEFEFFQI